MWLLLPLCGPLLALAPVSVQLNGRVLAVLMGLDAGWVSPGLGPDSVHPTGTRMVLLGAGQEQAVGRGRRDYLGSGAVLSKELY